jgi:hypothetical protein
VITVTAVIAASAVSQRGTISAPILRLPAANMTGGTMAGEDGARGLTSRGRTPLDWLSKNRAISLMFQETVARRANALPKARVMLPEDLEPLALHRRARRIGVQIGHWASPRAKADTRISARHVRYGSLTDIGQPIRDVRFTPESRHFQRQHESMPAFSYKMRRLTWPPGSSGPCS